MKAIVVIGQPNKSDIEHGLGTRFLEKAEIILSALREKLEFSKKDILVFSPDGTPGSGQKFKNELESIFLEYPDEDICLFYAGHGQKNGWGLSGTRNIEAMTYRQLRLIFACHFGNLIFVNYCCFAGAAKYALTHRAGESLLIAAMPKNKSGCAYNFCRLVMEQWADEKFFNPHISSDNTEYVPPVEGNESLQSLLFSRRRSFL